MKLLSLADTIYEKRLLEQLLTEANVANVKQPIGSEISILSYLQTYADGLAAPEVKQAFIKKLSAFLMNDERNLHALREVPNDAPDWAKQAVQTGQLMLFVPNDALNDKVQHIVHYLAACEQDVAQTANNDQKVFAQRELAGFGKAENLDLLATKSNEYFKRGSRNTKREASGMQQTFDAGDGFIWYELQTAEAFQREGKLLQNCIGSHYTPAKCQKEGMIIFVLRDGTDNTVAACRVKRETKGGTYELQELKGKQNKPPVDKYMKPSVKFLNKMKFVIGQYAMNDLNNAGYFYIENEFYDLQTAIKTFTRTQKIAELPSGGEVVRVRGESELMQKAYPYSADTIVYEVRDKAGEPQFCFYVKNMALVRIKNSKNADPNSQNYQYNHQTIDAGIDPAARNELFQVLLSKELVDDMVPQIRKHLFWNEQTSYNLETKSFEKVTPDKEHQLTPEDHKWDEYNSPALISEIHKVLSSKNERDYEKSYTIKAGDLKQVYLMRTDNKDKFVFAVTKNDKAVPGVIKNNEFTAGFDKFGYSGDVYRPTKRLEKDIKSLVNFANDKKLEIPEAIRNSHGIIKDPKTKAYSMFKPEKTQVLDTPVVTRYSFEGLDETNKKVAIKAAVHDIEFKNTDKQYYGEEIFSASYRSTEEERQKVQNATALYRIDITYGVDKPHKFILAVKDNTVITIDDNSKEQKWQKWDDFEKIASQINEVKDKLRLNFDASAATGSTEFKVVDGKLSTKSHDIKQKLERKKLRGFAGQESAESIPYEDGAKLVRLSTAEQAGWMRQGLGASNLKGEVWKVVKSDGTIPYAYFVDNGKIVRMIRQRSFRAGAPESGVMPNEKGYNQEALKYLKSAATLFGWKAADPSIMITPNEEDINLRDLKTLIDDRNKDKLTAIREIDKWPALQRLIRFGLAKRVYKEDPEDEFTHTFWMEPTEAGIKAYTKLSKGENVDGLAEITGKPIQKDFKLPEKEKPAEPVARPPAAPRAAEPQRAAAGGETKAAMAVTKFREMQTANGRIPTLGEFRRVLEAPPFSMSPLAAQTYYYSTKKRLAAPVGEGYQKLSFGKLKFSLLREISYQARI